MSNPQEIIERRRHIATGGVVLYVNRTANVWCKFTCSIPLKLIKDNFDEAAPIEVIIVFIIPGYHNPVNFTGTRITIKSRKGPKRVQVEAAIPDIPFPEDYPDIAKTIVMDLMLAAVEEVEQYAVKVKLIKHTLSGARSVLKLLQDTWDVSKFEYKIPDNLPFYDLPQVNEYTTRRFIEQLPDGGSRHYDMILDQEGNEVV